MQSSPGFTTRAAKATELVVGEEGAGGRRERRPASHPRLVAEQQRGGVLDALAVLVGRDAETQRSPEVERQRSELIVDLDPSTPAGAARELVALEVIDGGALGAGGVASRLFALGTRRESASRRRRRRCRIDPRP